MMYFLNITNLKSFGFPRLKGRDKIVKWKKMNFITYLPKHTPQVAYIVGSCIMLKGMYRMHVVALAGETISREHSE